MRIPARFLAYGALVLQTIISALNYLVAKRALGEIDPLALTMLRVSGTTLCFLPLLLWRGRQSGWPARRLWLPLAVLGILGVPFNQGFFLAGLSRTTPAHAALLYTLTPLFVFLIALALRTERAEGTKVFGLALALGGGVIVVLERSAGGTAGGTLGGDLTVLLGVVSWSGYTAFGKKIVKALGPFVATGWTLVLGSLFFIPAGAGAVARAPLGSLSPGFWWALAYLIVLTSVVSYLCWYYALGQLDPSRVAVFSNIQPVVTAIAAWLLPGGQRPTLALAAGGGLVIAGVVVATHETVRERVRAAMSFASERVPLASGRERSRE